MYDSPIDLNTSEYNIQTSAILHCQHSLLFWRLGFIINIGSSFAGWALRVCKILHALSNDQSFHQQYSFIEFPINFGYSLLCHCSTYYCYTSVIICAAIGLSTTVISLGHWYYITGPLLFQSLSTGVTSQVHCCSSAYRSWLQVQQKTITCLHSLLGILIFSCSK